MNYWLRRILRYGETEHQLEAELRFHVERRTAELVEAGADSTEARRQAALEFGGMEAIKESCRESRRVHFMETLLQDLRYGLRMLRRNPSFTAVAVVTLALGIGANTAIFSVINGVLLNRLPYQDPDRLVLLHESKVNFEEGAISYPNFLDWQKDNQVFTAMAAFRFTGMTLTGQGEAERLTGRMISAGFFPTLGVKPILGRSFTQEEDRIGAPPAVMISERLWRQKFSASPEITKTIIHLDDQGYSVVGVVPESFHLRVSNFNASDIYIPVGQWSYPAFRVRTHAYGMRAIARLKPGVTLAQAQADMDRISGNLARTYPADDTGIRAKIVPLKQQIVGSVRPVLLALFVAVGLVLLIACVNVANLLLARSTARSREFSVRMALGAPRHRVLRQLLTESVLLSLMGGTLGLVVACFGPHLALGLFPDGFPRMEEISVNWHVLLFALLVSIAVGVGFGFAPALRFSRQDSTTQLKDAGRGTVAVRRRTQSVFVIVEMALALVLLTGAGLMLRSIVRLLHVDPGFNPHNVVGFDLSLAPSLRHESPATIRATLREIEDRLSRTAGVQSVALGDRSFPLANDDEEQFWIDGQPKPASDNDMNWALWYEVTPDYFRTMGMSLKRGRLFSPADSASSSPVVVVDQEFATRFFPNQDPLGRRIHLKEYDLVAEIIGVVGHVKQWGLDTDETSTMQAQAYSLMAQAPDRVMDGIAHGVGVVVRSHTPPHLLISSLQHLMSEMNSRQVIANAQSLDEMVSDSIAQQRFTLVLFGVFAGLALLLASIGLYGVVSYTVNQRTPEIGIRMALGASRSDVLRLILGHGGRMAFVGLLAGIGAAFALTRFMSSFLYHVTPTDPLTFAGVAVLLCFVGLLATYIPARRATRVDPTVALRCE
jgi:predicted permease